MRCKIIPECQKWRIIGCIIQNLLFFPISAAGIYRKNNRQAFIKKSLAIRKNRHNYGAVNLLCYSYSVKFQTKILGVVDEN